jgi:hypothetical protein
MAERSEGACLFESRAPVPDRHTGYGHLREHFLDHTPLLLPLVTRLVVGSIPDGVAETSSPEWDRRLELPFTLEGAAA